jgi:single-stranded-DNA-specific exonuclease
MAQEVKILNGTSRQARYNGTIFDNTSLTGKGWRQSSNKLSTRPIISTLAIDRGINISETASWNNLCDPMEFSDMKKSVDRIHDAISKREKVGIIGDYDADGITGTAQLVRYFKRHEIEPHVILPHRIHDGYGVSKKFIDALSAHGTSLLITVDTGISHAEELNYAKNLGMDVIVTDHHSVPNVVPDSLILHPSRDAACGVSKVNKNLSGSGVVFTLIRALEDGNWKDKETDVALAAIGTVADVVPLLRENRLIVQLGLLAMNNDNNDPVFDLTREVLTNGERVTSSHIGFRIAPRINAAGRINDPSLALSALLAGGDAIKKLHAINEERQEETRRQMEIADELIDVNSPVITTASSDFHPGIVGLIAGRLTEKTGMPSCIGSVRDGKVTCSLRSISSYNIVEALKRCQDHLAGFGGHAKAAGCSVEISKWDEFAKAICADAGSKLSDEDLVPKVEIDLELESSDITLDNARDLQRLEPFGEGNREPLFLVKNQNISNLRCVGKEDQHLQCQIGDAKAVGFNLGHLLPSLTEHADIVCRLGTDSWGGHERVQMFVEDVSVAEKVGA